MMVKIIFLLLFSFNCYGFEKSENTEERSFKEVILGKESMRWSELLRGDKEPESLLESFILGSKIGLLIVSPISASVSYISGDSFLKTSSIFAKTFAGSIVFVSSFWLGAELLKKLGLYDGLDPKDEPPKEEYIYLQLRLDDCEKTD